MKYKVLILLGYLNKFIIKLLSKNPRLYEKYVLIPNKINQDNKRFLPTQKMIDELQKQTPFPIFSTIEIETINRCNGECDFCPVNRYDDTREFKLMSENLFYDIIHQLRDIQYDGRMQLFSNNEPLMDKRIFEFAKYAKEQLPNNHFSFFTNGTLLNLEKFKKLIPYCDTFCVDVYYDNPKNKFPKNITPIIEYCLENEELQNKVIFQFINKHAIRNNRGGNSKNRKNVYHLKTSCLLPFKQMIIRPDGKLSLCCNDPKGCFTLGDLTKESVIEAWRNEKYTHIRNLLQKAREEVKMCKYCDNFGGSGTNEYKDKVFTKTQFKISWDDLKKMYKG